MLPATLQEVNPVLSKTEYQLVAEISRSRNASTFLEQYSRQYPLKSPQSLIRSIEVRTDFSRMDLSTATQCEISSIPTIFRTRRANDGDDRNYMEVVVSLDEASYPSASELREVSITLNYQKNRCPTRSQSHVSRGERTDQ